ncbi:MAG: hypothetical protein AAGH87_10800 [Pseudomonadota bacterium]
MARAIVGVLAVFFSVLAAPPEASAEPSDILGAWSFETDRYRDGQCVMSGTMRLWSGVSGKQSGYQCELTALEVCTQWGQSVVRQTCDITRVDDQLTVRSQIAEVLQRKGAFSEGPFNYAPDNFALTVKSHSLMFGSLLSAVNAPVTFRRETAGIS